MYEGNVHERACIQAVRQNSSAEIVGYSHGVIFDNNLKFHYAQHEEEVRPHPDYYVCTGEYSKELLQKASHFDPLRLRPGCALRFIPSNIDNRKSKEATNILLALEGLQSAVFFLEWILEHAEIFRDYHVYLRNHPNVTMESLLDQCIGTLPENFTVSQNDLATDIEKSFCVIYRHSSVGIQAILNKTPVIHISVDSPLSGDPIEECKVGKWSVSSREELVSALDQVKQWNNNTDEALFSEAVRFMKSYFCEPTAERIREFVE